MYLHLYLNFTWGNLFNSSLSFYIFIYKMDITIVPPMVRKSNKIIYVKCLAQYLAVSEYSIKVSFVFALLVTNAFHIYYINYF